MTKVIVVLMLLGAVPALAQDEDVVIQKEIQGLAAANDDVFDKIDNFAGQVALQLSALRKRETAKLEGAVRADGQAAVCEILSFRRSDLQAGASGGATGSTSAVLNPLLPAIFGFSFEDGGITRSVSGSTLTLKANPVALFCASGNDAAGIARRDPETCATHWKRLGLTASFDTSRGKKSSQLEDLQTLDNQFSELSVRYELINRRTLTGEAFERHFVRNSKFESAANNLVNEMARLPGTIFAEFTPELARRLYALMGTTACQNNVNDPKCQVLPEWQKLGAEARQSRIRTVVNAMKPAAPDPGSDALKRLHASWLSALKAFQKEQNAVLNAPVLTVFYTYQKPDLATAKTATSIVPAGIQPPNLHTAGLIYAQGVSSRNLDIVANASASWFDDTRPGMPGSFRDFRTGIQATFRLREIPNYGAPSLSFAGLYAYLHQQPLGLGIVAFNNTQIREKGHLGLFQTKLEFPTGKNAVRIPISFTYSNRTELIKESDVRGQIGISFNLDQLFSAQ
jgi:hypothetical protein